MNWAVPMSPKWSMKVLDYPSVKSVVCRLICAKFIFRRFFMGGWCDIFWWGSAWDPAHLHFILYAFWLLFPGWLGWHLWWTTSGDIYLNEAGASRTDPSWTKSLTAMTLFGECVKQWTAHLAQTVSRTSWYMITSKTVLIVCYNW